MNTYLAVDSGGYFYTNIFMHHYSLYCLLFLICASIDAVSYVCDFMFIVCQVK